MKLTLLILLFLASWLIFAQSCLKMRITDSQAIKDFDKKGLTLQIKTMVSNHFKLHYVISGDNNLPTLFFVHGSPGSWDAYKQYLQDADLLIKYRMVSIDRPGFGYSQFGDAKNLVEQSNIISPLIDSLQNGKPIYIIGHSLGGPLAVQMVADHPDNFQGMVLLAAAVDLKEEPKEKWRGFFYSTPFQYLLPGAFRPSNEEIWYLKKDLIELANQFTNITCKVWIVHGDKDNFVPVGNANFAKEKLIHAKSVSVTILPGAPHFIPWEPWYNKIKTILLNLD